MTTPPPAAANARTPWSDLPERIRREVERRLGSPVVSARTQEGGFSPGVAARLTLADGGRAFVKAVSPERNTVSPSVHRREAQIVAAMPPTVPVPRLLWTMDDDPDGWVVLAFEDIEGRQPALPWRDDELDLVLDAMSTLAADLTPSPLRPPLVADAAHAFGAVDDLSWASLVAGPDPALDPWSARHLQRLARLEASAGEAARGDTLQHFDIRADNLLISAEGVRVVDWPHARIGQPWLDLVWFAPSVTMQGGPLPEDLVRRYPPARDADAGALDAVVVAVAAYFTSASLLPPLPGLPTLRAFQAAQAEAARAWVAARTGWD
ncbi:MAG TPA: aminoglycoside phosphotransferase family protein [Methylomirabilota bacterium]|nr:aminoglycoside phosphotransferase family protein [Methylomirabilota bacterium]